MRQAVPSDAPLIIDLKNKLRYSHAASSAEGFILGTSEESYLLWIKEAIVKVLEKDGQVLGYGICLPDHFFRKSDIWERRHQIDSPSDLSSLQTEPIAWFEQLAILPQARLHHAAPLLSISLVQEVFKTNHKHLLTSTVLKPWCNKAALPLLRRVRSRSLGTIMEHYPQVGSIQSEIHWIEKKSFEQQLSQLGLQHPWNEDCSMLC